MEWYSRAFLKSSLVWFGLGTTLGAVMSAWPMATAYRTAHFHMNLLGFVAMMIFGVAYHVIPRFVGHPLHRPRLAAVHWWVANAALVVLSLGFLLIPSVGATAYPVLAAGGVLSALGGYMFIYNMWRTLDGPAILQRVHRTPSTLPLLHHE